jgi:hypothetical protein
LELPVDRDIVEIKLHQGLQQSIVCSSERVKGRGILSTTPLFIYAVEEFYIVE